MHPVGFEPTISAGERPQTYALDQRPMGPAAFTLQLRKTKEDLSQDRLKCQTQFVPSTHPFFFLHVASTGLLISSRSQLSANIAVEVYSKP